MVSPSRAIRDPLWVRIVLIGIALAFLLVILILPIAVVFREAFRQGFTVYRKALTDPAAWSAIKLTLTAAAIAVPMNAMFGLAAAWAITRYDFRGKSLLTTLIDLPIAVSPVIAGMIFMLLFGLQGWFGEALRAHDIEIVFATPGIVLATTFVTFPFVARELIPFMETLGRDEEEAAIMLGASGWQVFFKVTLPTIKWSLLYGVILCNARAMGEFGAVSVVSGHVQGRTNTMPLHIEVLYGDFKFAAAFAVSSLLLFLALVTLVVKRLLEWQVRRQLAATRGAQVV